MQELNNYFLNHKNIGRGTPANAMIRFLYGWKNRNLNLMLEASQKTWKDKPMAKEKLEMWFGDLFLIGSKISKIQKINDFAYRIICQVGFKKRYETKAIIGLIKGDVICETKPHEKSINGDWGLNPLTILKALGVYKKIYIDIEGDNFR